MGKEVKPLDIFFYLAYHRRMKNLNENKQAQKVIERILEIEGGYVNDPDDPGRETNFGISKNSYPDLDIAALTPEEAKEIYYRDFYLHHSLDNYPLEVAHRLMDIVVHFGVKSRALVVQVALKFLSSDIEVDGKWGPLTTKDLKEAAEKNPPALLGALQLSQGLRYLGVVQKQPEMLKYLPGFLRRLA